MPADFRSDADKGYIDEAKSLRSRLSSENPTMKGAEVSKYLDRMFNMVDGDVDAFNILEYFSVLEKHPEIAPQLLDPRFLKFWIEDTACNTSQIGAILNVKGYRRLFSSGSFYEDRRLPEAMAKLWGHDASLFGPYGAYLEYYAYIMGKDKETREWAVSKKTLSFLNDIGRKGAEGYLSNLININTDRNLYKERKGISKSAKILMSDRFIGNPKVIAFLKHALSEKKSVDSITFTYFHAASLDPKIALWLSSDNALEFMGKIDMPRQNAYLLALVRVITTHYATNRFSKGNLPIALCDKRLTSNAEFRAFLMKLSAPVAIGYLLVLRIADPESKELLTSDMITKNNSLARFMQLISASFEGEQLTIWFFEVLSSLAKRDRSAFEALLSASMDNAFIVALGRNMLASSNAVSGNFLRHYMELILNHPHASKIFLSMRLTEEKAMLMYDEFYGRSISGNILQYFLFLSGNQGALGQLTSDESIRMFACLTSDRYAPSELIPKARSAQFLIGAAELRKGADVDYNYYRTVKSALVVHDLLLELGYDAKEELLFLLKKNNRARIEALKSNMLSCIRDHDRELRGDILDGMNEMWRRPRIQADIVENMGIGGRIMMRIMGNPIGYYSLSVPISLVAGFGIIGFIYARSKAKEVSAMLGVKGAFVLSLEHMETFRGKGPTLPERTDALEHAITLGSILNDAVNSPRIERMVAAGIVKATEQRKELLTEESIMKNFPKIHAYLERHEWNARNNGAIGTKEVVPLLSDYRGDAEPRIKAVQKEEDMLHRSIGINADEKYERHFVQELREAVDRSKYTAFIDSMENIYHMMLNEAVGPVPEGTEITQEAKNAIIGYFNSRHNNAELRELIATYYKDGADGARKWLEGIEGNTLAIEKLAARGTDLAALRNFSIEYSGMKPKGHVQAGILAAEGEVSQIRELVQQLDAAGIKINDTDLNGKGYELEEQLNKMAQEQHLNEEQRNIIADIKGHLRQLSSLEGQKRSASDMDRFRFYVETDPMAVLNLGVKFYSCLNISVGINSYGAIARAIDANNITMYANDCNGVVGRVSLIDTDKGMLVNSRFYDQSAYDLFAPGRGWIDALEKLSEAAHRNIILPKKFLPVNTEINESLDRHSFEESKSLTVHVDKAVCSHVYSDLGFTGGINETGRQVKIEYAVVRLFRDDGTGMADVTIGTEPSGTERIADKIPVKRRGYSATMSRSKV